MKPDELKPWMRGPFELIQHAEGHRNVGKDFDKRMALISYDNAVEVSIVTYLQLHPAQRSGKIYKREDVERWKTNFHNKLDFFDAYLKENGIAESVSRDVVLWYHDLRNDLYHAGNGMVPEEYAVEGARDAALFVFSALFGVDASKLIHKPTNVLHMTEMLGQHQDLASFGSASMRGRAELDTLAEKYDAIRAKREGSREQTREMDHIVEVMRVALLGVDIGEDEVSHLLESRSGGRRLAGLAAVQVTKKPKYFASVASIIRHSHSGFEQYHALWAMQEILPRLDSTQIEKLRKVLDDQHVIERIGEDSSRARIRERLLSYISNPIHDSGAESSASG